MHYVLLSKVMHWVLSLTLFEVKLCLCQQRLLLFGKKGLGDTKVKERRVVLFLELDMIVMHAAALAALADIPPTFHI